MNLPRLVMAGLLVLGFTGCASSYIYTVDGKKYRCGGDGGPLQNSTIIANCPQVFEPGWYQTRATPLEFKRAEYECTREAAMVPRVPYPSAPPHVPGSGIAAGFQRGINAADHDNAVAAAEASEKRAARLFGMCMNDRGWEYRE